MTAVWLHPTGRITPRAARTVTVGVAVGRVTLAAAVLARPEILARALGVDTVTARRLDWITRMFAVRDGLLGAGAGHAVLAGQPVRPWLWAQVAADGTDAAVVAVAAYRRRVSVPAGLVVAVAAAAGTAAGLSAARRV